MPNGAAEDAKDEHRDIIDHFRTLVADYDWKERALALLIESIEKTKPQASKPIFSFGEDDSDDISSDSVPEPPKITVQVESRPQMEEVLPTSVRSVAELEQEGAELLPGDVLRLMNIGKIKPRELESRLPDQTATAVRRAFVAPGNKLAKLPYIELPYTESEHKLAKEACCENMVGYMPLPVGIAGPLKISGVRDGALLHVPMATTEGALVASTNRGCTAIMKSGGMSADIYEEGMTRAPVVQFERSTDAVRLKQWIKFPANFAKIRAEFDGTSRFAKLDRIDVMLDGCLAHLRFTGITGDAMGMNMISKATRQAMEYIKSEFPNMKVVALSGNSCTDKKAAAINWINGRGRSVVADCVLPASVVKSVFRTTPADMAEAARAKLSSGSAAAGAIGGANAHAANIVAAIFIATGQDAAQVVSSSMCSTRLEEREDGSLYASVTMPCVECGTLGGGTILPAQRACLDMLGVAGPSKAEDVPGTNAANLAKIIASTVLAGELSLMAALCKDELVSSHLKLNRSRQNLYGNEPSGSQLPTVDLKRPIRAKPSKTTINVNCTTL